MGQHNGSVLIDLLGIGEEEYVALEEGGIIARVPTAGDPVIPVPIDDQLQKGRLAGWDPDYKEKLGIP